MAIAFAQAIKKQCNGTAGGTSASVTTTNGSTFVLVTSDPNTDLTISDSKSNTWAQAGSDTAIGGVTGQIWYTTTNTGGASHTFTVTANTGTMASAFHVIEITGQTTGSGVYDSAATATASDAASPFTVTSGTLTQANNLAIGFIWSNGAPTTWTAGGSFTKRSEETDDSTYWTNAVATLVTSATTAVTPSWTTSGGANTTGNMVVAFKEAAGGGGSTAGRSRMMMGFG